MVTSPRESSALISPLYPCPSSRSPRLSQLLSAVPVLLQAARLREVHVEQHRKEGVLGAARTRSPKGTPLERSRPVGLTRLSRPAVCACGRTVLAISFESDDDPGRYPRLLLELRTVACGACAEAVAARIAGDTRAISQSLSDGSGSISYRGSCVCTVGRWPFGATCDVLKC